MPQHLLREIEKLKKKVLALGARVEETVQRAVKSLKERDPALANQVINADFEIDQMEVDIEEECAKILALHQPVATDLRFIIAVLKINNDLERIADIAVNVAERSLFLAGEERIDIPFDFPTMADKTQSMLRKSLDALVNLDIHLAYQVLIADDEVDAMNREMYVQVQDGIRKHPEALERLIHLLGVSRHLERIGDHAGNIAEDIIYMIEGEIVRHRAERYKSFVEG